MYTFEFWSPHISAIEHWIFKYSVSTPHNKGGIVGGKHKNFEDLMLLSQDMRTQKLKNVQFDW